MRRILTSLCLVLALSSTSAFGFGKKGYPPSWTRCIPMIQCAECTECTQPAATLGCPTCAPKTLPPKPPVVIAPACRGPIRVAPAVRVTVRVAPAVRGTVNVAPAILGPIQTAPAVRGTIKVAPAVRSCVHVGPANRAPAVFQPGSCPHPQPPHPATSNCESCEPKKSRRSWFSKIRWPW